ncbi:MAG: hypothetical protein ACRD2P_02600 [Terriglobia bacterium]
MVVALDYKEFRTDGERWQWEISERIVVCALEACALAQREIVLKSIKDILTEFRLPFQCQTTGPDTQRKIEEIRISSTAGRVLNCNDFLSNLNEARRKDDELQPAYVVAFDGSGLSLDDGLYKPEEPPEWGWTDSGGVILLRICPDQPLRNVVRHEMGHLLGIENHHSGCVMDWACTQNDFCASCVETIRSTCQVASE